MSRKSKIEAVEKVKTVERYLKGEISQRTAAQICKVHKRSVQDGIRNHFQLMQWIRVYKSFDEAVRKEPEAHPLFHSDQRFQYTSAAFYNHLKKCHMKQSMSRVAHCIDNGPMEGFWGIPKKRNVLWTSFYQ